MALRVSNGTKSYLKGSYILKDLNMSVRRGEIYGLLGASGCGKTTLLSCVVGLRQLDRGDLIVFGQQRNGHLGQLCGYMPQEISLLNVFTINEALYHFGLIYGMSGKAIENRIDFLASFLDLPDRSAQIQYLSGGQKRRVSLAVVMIHNPPLLVLDEPTVGLDPTLRQRIWEHLFDLSRTRGTTMIISTHYIEECKRCDKVGFMRGGQLLAEDTPNALLTMYGEVSLEGVALRLCRLHESRPSTNADVRNDKKPLSTDPDKIFGDEKTGVVKAKFYRKLSFASHDDVVHSPVNVETNHLSILCALVLKAWRRRKRDWRFIFSELLMPLVVIIVLQNVVGLEPRNIGVSLVTGIPNLTNNAQLEKYCDSQRSNKSSPCLENLGICDFLGTFKPYELDWLVTDSWENGLNNIRAGRSAALVEFPQNYTNHMTNWALDKNYVSNETIHGTTISIRMDESSVITATWMKHLIATNYFKYLGAMATACGVSKTSVELAVYFNAIYGGLGIESIIRFSEPAMLVMLMLFLSQSAGVVWIVDRSEGLEDRDYAAGVTLLHRLVASMVADSIKIVVQLIVFVTLLTAGYGMRVQGSWALMLGLIYLASVEGLAIGWMLGTLRDDALEAIILVLCLFSTQASSSGLFLPLELSPDYVRQYFSHWLPATYPNEAMRSITSRGWGLENFYVTRGFITGLGWTLLCILIVLLAESRKHK
ncbi:ABC transporter G family member 23 [Folsomia candida]|uniref:ABC transporter G family member 23 n=1 Tax=Folsomia candida TaxID=158441 RepID=UPI00160552B3|nr:ABC transporter G family member 23 [Folsomia candida]